MMKSWFVCAECPMASSCKKPNFKKSKPWAETVEGCRARVLQHLTASTLHAGIPEQEKIDKAATAKVKQEEWPLPEEDDTPGLDQCRSQRPLTPPRGPSSPTELCARPSSPTPSTQSLPRRSRSNQRSRRRTSRSRSRQRPPQWHTLHDRYADVRDAPSSSSRALVPTAPGRPPHPDCIVIRRQQLQLIADVCRRAATAANTAYRVAKAAAAGFQAEQAVCEEAHEAILSVLDDVRAP